MRGRTSIGRIGWLRGLALACVVLVAGLAHATPATSVPTPATTAPAASLQDTATARFFNRDIVTFRSRFLGNTPQMRARAAEANIERIVEHHGVAKATSQDAPQGVVILLDGQLVTVVTPADVDTLRNETLAGARDAILARLTDAVRASETARAPARLARGIGWSLIATVAMLLGLWILRWSLARLRSRVDAWATARLTRIPNESARQMALAFLASGRGLARVFAWILVLFVIEEWLRFCFAQFVWTQPWAGAMTQWMAGRLSKWGNAILHAVPGLVTAIVILLVARVFVQAIRLAFQGVEHGRFRLVGIDSQLAEPTRKIVVAIVWLFALAMAYPYLPGAETDAFKGLSLFVGLMVSLGASSIVGQAAGGFTLLYSRMMSVGDVVRVGDVEGTVQQIALFTTRIRTPLGVEVSFPNSVVMAGKLENLSRAPEGPGVWLQAVVVIGYDVPWRQVHRLLLDAARGTPDVIETPPPMVLQTALGDFGIEYRLRARIGDVQQRWIALSALHAQIQDVFNGAGVQIMTPHYEGDPETAKVVPRAHWEGSADG
ncbi:Mechanosensitive ion channel family protein [Lysobacter dokdonensis DS-58]|uniref:Small-conductance mechanosensitive channel n=1 Tax=Lysobacter dokdonensis DS-58 TaxID=1300345 RepID=A0A0A2WP50_9GAMM|nr:mechanosensitive ion channel domain-containing protein [Lysobacter dokdonensis]KGQ20055.1 Mechanosensitive ion channel family protein [Lysobacter dokdonensis DS-58]